MFPQPTSIPILEMQMDVDFNQTEIHMSDPSTRNTELRPDAWRDPDEQQQPALIDGQPSFDQAVGTDVQSAPAILAVDHDPTQAPAENVQTQSDEVGNDLMNLYSGMPSAAAAPELLESGGSELAPADVPSSMPNLDASILASATANSPAGDEGMHSLLDDLQTSLAPAAETHVNPEDSALLQSDVPTSDQVASDPNGVTNTSGPPTGLPPRPPPQEQPNIHPNFMHSQHIRDYHPHATNSAFQSHTRTSSAGTAAELTSPSVVQSGESIANDPSARASQASPAAGPGLPTAPTNSERIARSTSSSTNPPIESRRERKLAAGEIPGVDDQPWNADVQRKYDFFLEEERKYVNEARWDQFPAGSRLFVGNLSSEKVTKRDIFHVFHTYGDLAQISIKQAYGFVQFIHVNDCVRAMEGEQGRQVREKRIHLEVSKPQKSKGGQQKETRRSRSRSPNNRGRGGRNADRYTGGGERGSNGRGRDGYRAQYRSPSPRGYRDRADDRYRARSRSPGYGRDDRYGNQGSPRDTDDDLPLPHRAPRDVPDVQIIVLTELNREFIGWVEQHFSARSVSVNTLRLAPRLSEEAVVHRQIMEGVLAVVKLKRTNQDTSKIGLTVFKRKGGMRDVQFEEYDNLDPSICVELVLREKQTQASNAGYQMQYSTPMPPPPQQYGYQTPSAPLPQQSPTPLQYAYPPGYPPPPQYGAAPPPPPQHLQNISTNNLQHLLANLGQAPAPAAAQYGAPRAQPGSAAYPPPAGFGQYPGMPPPPPQHHQQHQAPHNPYLGGAPPGVPQQQGAPVGQSPANMQDILARLGTYGSRQ
jgi:hypothetical protein